MTTLALALSLMAGLLCLAWAVAKTARPQDVVIRHYRGFELIIYSDCILVACHSSYPCIFTDSEEQAMRHVDHLLLDRARMYSFESWAL